MSDADLVSLEDIRAAADRIRGVVNRTPLVPDPDLSRETGGQIWLKCESLQKAGSFKARGASNFVSRLSDEVVSRGVITYSSGNHAQAVAFAAGLRGVRAVVVMPTTAPEVKVEGARSLGATVEFAGTTSNDRKVRAEEIAAAEGLVMIPPFDHPDIIAGQGTVALEVYEDLPEVDVLYVPIGGGGQASGCGAALRALRPGARIIGVEPRGAPTMRAALDQGGPVTLDGFETIADGLAPVRAGDLTYAHARAFLDDVVLVDDPAIEGATAHLLKRRKLVVEFSGAATVAAVRAAGQDLAGKTVCAVVSGGNMDPSFLSRVVAADPAA